MNRTGSATQAKQGVASLRRPTSNGGESMPNLLVRLTYSLMISPCFHPSCATGSCGTSLKCGASGATPVSLAEFTLAADRDFYDVSLVDGFNLPLTVRPVNGHGGGNCSAAGCDGDLRETCPPELAVKGEGGGSRKPPRPAGCAAPPPTSVD